MTSSSSTSTTAEDIKEREREREVGWMIDKLTSINEKCKLIHNADSDSKKLKEVYKKNKVLSRLNQMQRTQLELQIEAVADSLWMKLVYITHSEFTGSLKGLVACRQMSMVLAGLMEARQAAIDIFDIYLSKGESVEKIIESRLIHWLTELIDALEDLIQQTQLRRAQKRATVVARGPKHTAKALPLTLSLAVESPIVMAEERLSYSPVLARNQLFEAMPDIKDFRSHFTGFQLLKYDETVMLLFITDFLGKAVYRLYCDPAVVQFRGAFVNPLRTAFASARGNAWIMLRKVQRVDLTLGSSDPLQSTTYTPGARLSMSTTFSPIVENKERSSTNGGAALSHKSGLGAIGEITEENGNGADDGAPASPTSPKSSSPNPPFSSQAEYDRRFIQSSGSSPTSAPKVNDLPSSSSSSLKSSTSSTSSSSSSTSSASMVPPPLLSTLSRLHLGLPPEPATTHIDTKSNGNGSGVVSGLQKNQSSVAMTPILAASTSTSTMHSDVFNTLNADIENGDWDAPHHRSDARRNTAADLLKSL